MLLEKKTLWCINNFVDYLNFKCIFIQKFKWQLSGNRVLLKRQGVGGGKFGLCKHTEAFQRLNL